MKQLADRTCPTCGGAAVSVTFACGASTRRENAVSLRTTPCGSSAPGPCGGAVQQDLPLDREEQAQEAARRG